MTTGTAPSNGIEIAYETHGDPDDEPLLLVMGLGAQLIAWPVELVDALVDRGFYVVRYDNRDVGLSTKIDGGAGGDFMAQFLAAFQGQPVQAPYLLTDMAADGIGVLDHLGIASAHIVGASMGGMIVQTMAIEHPTRVRTLTSIMSTTGEQDVGQPLPDAMQALLSPVATTRDEAIARSVETSRVIASPVHFDEAAARKRAEEAYDRCFHPAGVARQLLAIVASGSRAEGLAQLDVPALVVHGTGDPLVTVTGGQRTAELVPGADLLLIDDMAHDLPLPVVPQIVDAITSLAARAAA
ncbi:MAG: alpha/beta fold hydrolase [Acidimicrobiales bacterium]